MLPLGLSLYRSLTNRAALEEVAGATGLALDGNTMSGDGLSVTIETESRGKSTVTVVKYTCALPGFPAHLKLEREGVSSGRAAALGVRELVTGDPDFDDFFWIVTDQAPQAQAYLTAERRALLLHHLDNCPEACLEAAQVIGNFDFKGTGPLTARVLALQALSSGLDDPQPLALRAAGWVNQQQRTHFARLLGLAALALGGTLVAIASSVDLGADILTLGLTEVVLLNLAALGVWKGRTHARKMTQVALVALPLVFLMGSGLLHLQTGGVNGLPIFALVLTTAAATLSYVGWLKLTRLRLGAPLPASCAPAVAAPPPAVLSEPTEDWAS